MVLIYPNSLSNLSKEVVAIIEARGGSTTSAPPEAVTVVVASVEMEGRGIEVEVAASTILLGLVMGIFVTLKAL